MLVVELEVHLHLAIRKGAIVRIGKGAATGHKSLGGGLIDKDLGRPHRRGSDKLDLFGLAIADRNRTLHLVDMVLKKAAFLHSRSSHRAEHGGLFGQQKRILLRNSVNVASHQLELGILIGRPALIVQAHPPGHRELPSIGGK